jgi:hypothetical protein
VAGATFAIAGGQGGWNGLLLLALLLSVAFGLVLAGLELITTFVLSSVWLRRAPGKASRLAARGAVALGGVGAIYLGLWWRARRTQLGATGWLDVLSLVLITILALSLARLTAVAGTLVVARSAVEGLPSLAPPSRRRLLPLALILILATALVVFIRWPAQGALLPGALEVTPQGRLLVVGIDGLDQQGLTAMAHHEMMPVLRSLMADASVQRVNRDATGGPPAVWTTYATGKASSEHGIAGAQWHSLAGVPAPVQAGGAVVIALAQAVDALLPLGGQLATPRPVSARIRRNPTIWEVLASQDIPVAMSHWWATSPLPELPGCAASDRAFFLLSAGAEVSGDIKPADDAVWWGQNFSAWQEEVEKEMVAEHGETSQAMMADRFHADHFLRCLAARRPQHGFLYLWSLDGVQSAPSGELSDLLAGPGRVAAAAQLVDDVLARLVEGLQADDRVVLLLDPGRTRGDGEALMAIWGPGVAVGTGSEAIAADRIMPTLLWLAGFPVPDAPESGPVTESLSPAARSLLPVRRVDSLGGPPSMEGQGNPPLEAETREYLKSLGYIE